MSDTYFIGVDQAAGEDVAAIAMFKLRPDGVREWVSFTQEPDEIEALLADTDFRSPPD